MSSHSFPRNVVSHSRVTNRTQTALNEKHRPASPSKQSLIGFLIARAPMIDTQTGYTIPSITHTQIHTCAPSTLQCVQWRKCMFRMYICIKCTRLEIWLGLACAVGLTDRPSNSKGTRACASETRAWQLFWCSTPPPVCQGALLCTDDHKRAQD